MTITQITNLPNRQQAQEDFDDSVADFFVQLPTVIDEMNALGAGMDSLASGGAYALQYTFSSTITDSDPGNGFLRLSSATQNASTALRLDLVGADGSTYLSVIDTFDDSGSIVKGTLRLVKRDDATKWLMFNVTAVASPAGYRNVTIVPLASSATSPFVNGDSLCLHFQRTGDVGTAGTLTLRASSITSDSAPTPNADNTDLFLVTALATAPTFSAPSGTPSDGQGLTIRIKDNGTARLLAWHSIYRAGGDLALPSTTVLSKVLYVGFRYNSVDTKWDLVAVLNNI